MKRRRKIAIRPAKGGHDDNGLVRGPPLPMPEVGVPMAGSRGPAWSASRPSEPLFTDQLFPDQKVEVAQPGSTVTSGEPAPDRDYFMDMVALGREVEERENGWAGTAGPEEAGYGGGAVVVDEWVDEAGEMYGGGGEAPPEGGLREAVHGGGGKDEDTFYAEGYTGYDFTDIAPRSREGTAGAGTAAPGYGTGAARGGWGAGGVGEQYDPSPPQAPAERRVKPGDGGARHPGPGDSGPAGYRPVDGGGPGAEKGFEQVDIICDGCGAEVPADSSVCPVCGQVLFFRQPASTAGGMEGHPPAGGEHFHSDLRDSWDRWDMERAPGGAGGPAAPSGGARPEAVVGWEGGRGGWFPSAGGNDRPGDPGGGRQAGDGYMYRDRPPARQEYMGPMPGDIHGDRRRWYGDGGGPAERAWYDGPRPSGALPPAGDGEDDEERGIFLWHRPVIPLMQGFATAFLVAIFVLAHHFKPEVFNIMGMFSAWVGLQPPALAATLATIAGFFFVSFPYLDQPIKKTVLRSALIIFLLILFLPPLITWAATGEGGMGLRSLGDNLLSLVKFFLLIAFWAPVTLGVIGIWSRKPPWVAVSAAFLLTIPAISDVLLVVQNEIIPGGREMVAAYLGFALLLFLYVELADGSHRFLNLAREHEATGARPGPMGPQVGRILQRYFTYMVLFSVMCALVVFAVFNMGSMVKYMGSGQIAESLELGSVFGTVFLFITFGTGLFIAACVVKYEKEIREWASRVVQWFRDRFGRGEEGGGDARGGPAVVRRVGGGWRGSKAAGPAQAGTARAGAALTGTAAPAGAGNRVAGAQTPGAGKAGGTGGRRTRTLAVKERGDPSGTPG